MDDEQMKAGWLWRVFLEGHGMATVVTWGLSLCGHLSPGRMETSSPGSVPLVVKWQG